MAGRCLIQAEPSDWLRNQQTPWVIPTCAGCNASTTTGEPWPRCSGQRSGGTSQPLVLPVARQKLRGRASRTSLLHSPGLRGGGGSDWIWMPRPARAMRVSWVTRALIQTLRGAGAGRWGSQSAKSVIWVALSFPFSNSCIGCADGEQRGQRISNCCGCRRAKCWQNRADCARRYAPPSSTTISSSPSGRWSIQCPSVKATTMPYRTAGTKR